MAEQDIVHYAGGKVVMLRLVMVTTFPAQFVIRQDVAEYVMELGIVSVKKASTLVTKSRRYHYLIKTVESFRHLILEITMIQMTRHLLLLPDLDLLKGVINVVVQA